MEPEIGPSKGPTHLFMFLKLGVNILGIIYIVDTPLGTLAYTLFKIPNEYLWIIQLLHARIGHCAPDVYTKTLYALPILIWLWEFEVDELHGFT